MTTKQKAQRDLNNFASYVRRNDLTGWVKDRNAAGQYERAFRSVVALEDEAGVEAAAAAGDRLRKLRWEADDAGLLSPHEVLEAERRVLNL